MRPLILLTNDDGIHSPGLKAAAEATAHLGDLLLVAPRFQQTAMSRSLPVGPDMGIIEAIPLKVDGVETTVYGVHGSPAQAVKHALLELAPRRPSLCISGINYGENLGVSLTTSGTVGAAMEAAAWDILSIAISIEADVSLHHAAEYGDLNWEIAAHFTACLTEMVLRQGLPPEIALLNANVPATATRETPMRVTSQSHQSYFHSFVEGKRDLSQKFRFSYAVNVNFDTLDPDDDISVFLRDRQVSVTPLSLDLTARLPIKAWFEQFSAR
jgi:5'-nucleotidase